jgi:hypothetical protein
MENISFFSFDSQQILFTSVLALAIAGRFLLSVALSAFRQGL